MAQGQDRQRIDTVLRALATASRSLRLYPPASPIPHQSVEAVEAAIVSVFETGGDQLLLAIGREGFEFEGLPAAVGVPGGSELSDEFRAQGVSAVHFSNGVTADDILELLVVLSNDPATVRQSGGFAAALTDAGVRGVGVTEVQLTIMDAAAADDLDGSGLGNSSGDGTGSGFGGSGDGAEELAGNPGKLGAWIAQAASAGPGGLETGILSLAQAVGPAGQSGLAASMAAAMNSQPTETRDTLLGLAMQAGPFRDLMAEVFRTQSASEIATSVLAGAYGRNMLSLSTALTSLPLDRLDDQVRAQVHSMLPASGHTEAELRFLDHMIEIRQRTEPEPSLAVADHTYLAVAEAAAIRPEDLERARTALQASGAAVDAASVRALLALLDQQTDAAQAEASASHLVQMAERALTSGQIKLADYVVAQLIARKDRFSLAPRLPQAATPEALAALIDATLAQPELLPSAERLMTAFGPSADAAFVSAAVSRKAEGVALADRLLGKRMLEHLNPAALGAKFFQLGPVVTRLAAEGDSRSAATIEALSRRPDAQSRREIVLALSAAGGPLAQRLLPGLVSDADPEVAVLAARALGKAGAPDAGGAIAARISQLDMDNTDFELARELIVALGRTPGRSAGEALEKLASRRALIKRGHFLEVQAAVNSALATRAQEAVR